MISTQIQMRTEYAYCANRGICDFSIGECACFTGYGGASCEVVVNSNAVSSNAAPGMQVNVYGNSFSTTALNLRTERHKAPDFNFISVASSEKLIFNVRGDGLVYLSDLTVAGGGLKVLGDGVTILDGGMEVFSSSSSTPVATFASTTDTGKGVPVLVLTSVTSQTSSNYLMRVQSEGTTRFTIRADGQTDIYGGGLVVSMGMSIQSGGLTVLGGQTIKTNGLLVLTGGATILFGGLFISNSGASIMAGGLVVMNGISLVCDDNVHI